MFKKHFISAFALFALPLLSFSQFRISGEIKDHQTGLPVAGVRIQAVNTFLTTQSDSSGTFEISKLKPGSYILQFSFIGYQTRKDTIILTQDHSMNVSLKENTLLMDEVVVTATRADENSAMAYGTLNKEEIAEQNLGQDLPYLLNQQTSVVTTSDAGAGVGYTGIRMRGVDATRINVTINGIPVNDSESQGAYWVDLPDIASSIDNIQIQRGLGTSTNGAGAFGGSLNILTNKLLPKAYGEYSTSYGSFNTWKNTVNVGSGLINEKFAFDIRLSKIVSDGFIDRASSDLKSYYVSGAYYGKKTILKFITFSGLETTYQSWYGIPESRLKGDTDGMNNYIARNGLDTEDAANLILSGNRTYNSYTYQNQVDHYKQDYYQLHYSRTLNKNLTANVALHYTRGKGYYEEYKKGELLSSYGLNNVTVGSATITKTNLVRRRWLDNHFYGTTFSLNYDTHKNFSALIGGAYNQYDGLHYGEIIWAQFASNSRLNETYYKDTAQKNDFNIFIKGNYVIAKVINVFADLQYRTIRYSFYGFDDSLRGKQQTVALGFINPKLGVTVDLNDQIKLYASYSIGSKEPGRSDYIQSTPSSRPRPEKLNDLEVGYKHYTRIAMWSLNAYYMQYKDQLVLTGEINDVGAYNRTNVKDSYRRGIEAEIGIRILKKLSWNGNVTLSKNKINNYEEFTDNYDSTAQRIISYKETDIAFSPNLIAGSTFAFEPFKNIKISFISKYVGEQYLDNTSNASRKLDAYLIHDVRINYSFKTKYIRQISLIASVNNIFSEQYESNGYTYGYISGGERITENFYYAQAGINFMGGISLKF
ncbi:MAG: TonB-dependent receptor [Bacteroidota bacterium]|nr:TonB-dependent receptor [Bacteroidota bacterium]